MMKKATIILTVFALLFVAVGCSSINKMEQQKSFADMLYAAKNPYVGNSSADGDLVSLLNLGKFGRYTLSIENQEHPYTLAIRYMYMHNNVDYEKFDSTMTNSSILLLALIGNCDQISWSYPSPEGTQTGAIGLDYIKEVMGIDVKKMAKDEETFRGLCDQLFPERAAKAE